MAYLESSQFRPIVISLIYNVFSSKHAEPISTYLLRQLNIFHIPLRNQGMAVGFSVLNLVIVYTMIIKNIHDY